MDHHDIPPQFICLNIGIGLIQNGLFFYEVDQMLTHRADFPLGIGEIDVTHSQRVIQLIKDHAVRWVDILRNGGRE